MADAYLIPRKTTQASQRENAPLNRYCDVLPYDHNRIKLEKPIKERDYINASLVKVDLIDQAYILTQGPLASTVAHFWSMVWQEKSKAIVMLNKVIECNEIKCHKYWPDANDSEFTFEGPNYNLKVKYVSEIASQFYTVRNLILIDNQVQHFFIFSFLLLIQFIVLMLILILTDGRTTNCTSFSLSILA